MDYLKAYREMISLRGLTDHTIKSYSTYIRSYLDYLQTILGRQPEDVSWEELREYIRWLQKDRFLSDRTINHCISQLRFFTLYVLHKPWDPTQLPMRKFDSYLPFVPTQKEAELFISSLRVWKAFKNSLYEKDWCPYIKETFNGFGNAIEYLGRYTHRVAISNNRILSVTETEVTFSARGKKPGDPKREITISHEEFIRRFLMHMLPAGFQKIRYYGFLNNRMKSRNLKVIFRIQGGQRFRKRYAGLSMAELLKAVWNIDLSICPECGCASMQQLGRSYAPFP